RREDAAGAPEQTAEREQAQPTGRLLDAVDGVLELRLGSAGKELNHQGLEVGLGGGISDGESDDRESPDHDRKHREETGEREGEGVVAGLALAVRGQHTSWKIALGALEQTLYLRARRRGGSPPGAQAPPRT